MSAWRLRDWLEDRRRELEGVLGAVVPRPTKTVDEPNADVSELKARIIAVRERLTADLPVEASQRSPSDRCDISPSTENGFICPFGRAGGDDTCGCRADWGDCGRLTARDVPRDLQYPRPPITSSQLGSYPPLWRSKTWRQSWLDLRRREDTRRLKFRGGSGRALSPPCRHGDPDLSDFSPSQAPSPDPSKKHRSSRKVCANRRTA